MTTALAASPVVVAPPYAYDACLTIEAVDEPACPVCEGTGEIAVFDGQTTVPFPCGACDTYWRNND